MSHASTNSLPAPRATFDLRDGYDATCAQVAEKKPDGGFADQFGRLLPVFLDPRHVDMGNEIVRIGTCNYEHADGLVGLGALDERNHIAHQLRPQKVHRRRRDFRQQNGSFIRHFDRIEIHRISLVIL
jgi:hypothetical protein